MDPLLGRETEIGPHDGFEYATVFRPPEEKRHYVLGADVAEGLPEGDFSCGQVLDYETLEQVAVWHGHIPPDEFAYELFYLGAMFNWAYLACEWNGVGQVTLNVLHKHLAYPNLYVRQNLSSISEKVSYDRPGFVTSSRTKPVILDRLASLLRDPDGGIVLYDEHTIKEVSSFTYDHTRSGREAYSAPEGEHDDRVMALAIACEARRQYVPPEHPGQDLEFERIMTSMGYGLPKHHPRRRYQRDAHRERQRWGQQ